MEAIQTQQTEKAIMEMLDFLDSSSDDEEDSFDDEPEDDDEDAYESAKDEEIDIFDKELPHSTIQKSPNSSSIAKEIQKIKGSVPIWNTRELTPSPERLLDPIWRQANGNVTKCDQAAYENDWNSKLESNCRRSTNSYVREVNRAIYGSTNGHPANGSADYFQAAQNYAIYGKDFLDFPKNITPLLLEKKGIAAPVVEPNNSSPVEESAKTPDGYGNGLYPTPAVVAPESPSVNFANFSKQLAVASTAAVSTAAASTAAASTAAYYQMCGLQPAVRTTAGTTTATGSTAYGMFLGNKVTYVAAAPSAAPQLIYNQHSSTTTNFISNSLANAALAPSPAILYSNPMLTTTTQQYLNTFFKETQYLSGGTTQSAITGTTTGIYERLIYAQMLQQQIYHQTQQQAAAVAAMFQHKQRPRANGLGTVGVSTASGSIVTAGVSSAGVGVASGLHLCGRQGTIVNQNSIELMTKNMSTTSTMALTNAKDELATTSKALAE